MNIELSPCIPPFLLRGSSVLPIAKLKTYVMFPVLDRLLRVRSDLPTSAEWQYLKLQHLLIAKYGLAAPSASESPASVQEMKPTLFLITIYCQWAQCLRNEWNREMDCDISPNQWKAALTRVSELAIELKLWFIQQNIMSRTYWTLQHVFQKGLSKSS